MFPALHESLTFNFEARPITSTTVEQTFTLTSTQVRANNCPSTSAKNMQHATNVKGSIMRDMTDYIASHTNNKRTRLVRSSKSRADYLTRAAAFGKHISSMTRVNGKIVLPPLRQTKALGKKLSEVMGTYNHTRVEMTANAKKGSNRASSTDIIAAVKTAIYTKRNGLDTVPVV